MNILVTSDKELKIIDNYFKNIENLEKSSFKYSCGIVSQKNNNKIFTFSSLNRDKMINLYSLSSDIKLHEAFDEKDLQNNNTIIIMNKNYCMFPKLNSEHASHLLTMSRLHRSKMNENLIVEFKELYDRSFNSSITILSKMSDNFISLKI